MSIKVERVPWHITATFNQSCETRQTGLRAYFGSRAWCLTFTSSRKITRWEK